MLCLVPGVTGPQLDVPAALRVAVLLLGMIREGIDEGFAKHRTETRNR
jgi:hypothetical protein